MHICLYKFGPTHCVTSASIWPPPPHPAVLSLSPCLYHSLSTVYSDTDMIKRNASVVVMRSVIQNAAKLPKTQYVLVPIFTVVCASLSCSVNSSQYWVKMYIHVYVWWALNRYTCMWALNGHHLPYHIHDHVFLSLSPHGRHKDPSLLPSAVCEISCSLGFRATFSLSLSISICALCVCVHISPVNGQSSLCYLVMCILYHNCIFSHVACSLPRFNCQIHLGLGGRRVWWSSLIRHLWDRRQCPERHCPD